MAFQAEQSRVLSLVRLDYLIIQKAFVWEILFFLFSFAYVMQSNVFIML